MGAVASCLRTVVAAIGSFFMAIINGIGAILMALVNGVAAICNGIITVRLRQLHAKLIVDTYIDSSCSASLAAPAGDRDVESRLDPCREAVSQDHSDETA